MFPILFMSFLYGIVIGSFLNVVIYRIPLNKKLTGRSQCPSCGHKLSPLELVPVFSYLAQKKKCKSCGEKISPRYMRIELLTGVLFLIHAIALTYFSKLSLMSPVFYVNLIVGWVTIATLVSITFIDIETMEIPDRFHVILIASSIVLTLVNGESLLRALISGVIIGVPMFIIAFITLGLGLGDVKLLFASGMLLGAYNTNIVLIIASISALIFAMVAKVKKGKEFPFGPHIAIGMYLTLLYVAGTMV